jgi:hypothetical protein
MRARYLPALLGAGLLAAALAQLASGASPPAADPNQLAQALRTAPEVSFSAPGRVFASAADARGASDALASAVPLPAGGNFNGVRWEEAGAGLTEADVHAVQQYNAACQWLRALADGRNAALARAVLGDVPAWPGFRANANGALWRDALAGFPDGELARGVLADCRASHEREVAYAKELGLAPSG